MAHRRLLILTAAALLALMLAIPASGASRSQMGAARATARYYASFGPEQPLARPAPAQASLPTPDSGPGWALAICAGVALLAAGTLAGRVSVRPRHPAL